MPISLWLFHKRLVYCAFKDKGSQTKHNIDKVRKDTGPYIKF